MAETLSDRLRSLLASDVYSSKGRLRADDLLVRERVGRGLGEASTRLRELISRWRAHRVPPSTREQPSARGGHGAHQEGRAPLPCHRGRRHGGARPAGAERRPRLGPVRGVGLDEPMQFDWGLVGESDGHAAPATAQVG